MQLYLCIMHYVFILFLCLITTVASAKQDTIRVYYPINVSELTSQSVKTIDSLIYLDILRPGKKVGILGYADYLGSEETNIALSEARANKMKVYLLHMGMKENDIQIVIGKGEVTREGMTALTGNQTDRRVDIIPGGFKELPVVKKKEPAVKLDTPKRQIINLAKVKANQTINLNKIFFYPGSHKVREESIPYVDSLYMLMKDYPTLEIRIEGHICCVVAKNSDGYDYDSQDFKLSENRAKEIYDILIEKGIDDTRMEYLGYGKTRPLVWPERTEEDENKNRRVEIRILKK